MHRPTLRLSSASLAAAAAVATAASLHAGVICPCLGDLSGNGVVDGADLGVLLGAWGTCADCGACPADISGDCKVDGADLGILLGGWGACDETPSNDLCASATTITAFTGSANPFCTIGAGTDGPNTAGCSAPAIDTVHGDVWFRFTAPITGVAQLGVCADFDVRMAVYGQNIFGACNCPGGLLGPALLTCSGTDAFIVCPQGTADLVPIVAGECYTVRIGGAPGQAGTGNLDINLYVPPCDLASNTKLAAGGIEANTEYGIAIDISDDFAVGGAIFDDLLFGVTNAGSARVYKHNGTSWAVDQTLISPDAFASQRFGVSAAISGDRILVGAGAVDEDCPSDPACETGIAYLYEYDGTDWIHGATFVPGDGTPQDHFASRLDIDGGRVIISANEDDSANGDRAGAAHVWEYTPLFGGLWLHTAKLVASDGDDFDQFGSDVAISGAWAIVGCDHDEAGGSAYVFEDTGGSWVQRQKLHPAGLPATADFGYSVAIEDDVILIGAPDFNQGPGAVYVFENFGALGWLHTTTLTAHDGADDDSFGSSVSVCGLPLGSLTPNQVLVGAGGDDAARGAAYLFWRVNGGWVERAKLVAQDGVAGDSFGIVAISNGRGLVGAYLDNNASGTDAGSVYVFNGLGECTGNGVADACDIASGLADSDGDGVPDICEP